MEKTKDITAMEYAKYKGCTVQNVRKHFIKPIGIDCEFFAEVIKVKHYSRFYLFVVDATLPIPE